MSKSRFNDHLAKELRQRYEEGKPIRQLVEEYGGSDRSVLRAIHRAGGKSRQQGTALPVIRRPRESRSSVPLPNDPVLVAIRTARTNKGLRQTDVAKGIGIDGATYSRIETGQRPLNEDRRQKLFALLDITESDLSTPSEVKQEIDTIQKEIDETSDEAIATILNQAGCTESVTTMITREGTEAETVMEIVEYIRHEAPKHALSPRLALEQIAERIESGQWHRYQQTVGIGTNPELWR